MKALGSAGLVPTSSGEGFAQPGSFTFPGGEHHLRNIPDFDEPVTWIADVRGADPNDLVKAALLADVAHQRNDRFVLWLPYAPAARADRGQPLGVKVYADLINTMQAERVVIIDPHSPTVVEHLNHVVVADVLGLIDRVMGSGLVRRHFDGVIAPDKGATERAAVVAKHLDIDLYQAEKDRDFETGRILGIRMLDRLPESGGYLVVDDICDGGGTFKLLAQATGLPREQLALWVTHGIFSGIACHLRDDYHQIFTTDSHPGHNRVDVATTIVPTFTSLFTATTRS
ncbi:hypothetical protein A5751_23045 [Mycolicibacterium fortuitum]|nr:hypothetical protein A5751_23045 [Mycolicibacterium fortuitum]